MTRWTPVLGALGLLILAGSAHAAPFGKDPVEAVKEEVEKEMTEKEKATEERLKKFEEEQAKNKARVVVIQWQGSDLTFNNELLQRNIKARTTRSNAVFVPDVDLYQQGRREPDTTLRPLDQRAKVPSSAIPTVMAAHDAVAAIAWNGLPEQEWGVKAAMLKSLADELWFIDREELREPLFLLYSQIGRAAENANNSSPPYYEEVGGIPVPYFYYQAAAMATQTPELMSKLHDSDLIAAIGNLKSQIEQGRFRQLSLNFEMNGLFDPKEFTGEYLVYIDGVETQITNSEALYEVPAGRVDVRLERADDGHGLSVRVEEVKVDAEEVYSVREQARKRMGLDFQNQLMKNKNQCLPEVDDDVLTYVAIYQKLHPGQEIYIAVPEGGSINRIHLWKWIEEKGQLVKIEDAASQFPVRFVGLVGTGLHLGGASFSDPFETPVGEDPPVDAEAALAQANPGELVEFKPTAVPIAYELRGHWDRLMVGIGIQYNANLQSDGWVEIAQTDTGRHYVYTDPLDPSSVVVDRNDNRILMSETDVLGNGDRIAHPKTRGQQSDEAGYAGRRFQRLVHAEVGGVLGREAAAGFGPRGAVRVGWYNAPHAVDLTGRLGLAIAGKPKKKRKANNRVQVIIDTDLFGGVMLPYGDTLRLLTNVTEGAAATDSAGNAVWGRMNTSGELAIGNDRNAAENIKLRKIGAPIPTFGFELKAGLTF